MIIQSLMNYWWWAWTQNDPTGKGGDPSFVYGYRHLGTMYGCRLLRGSEREILAGSRDNLLVIPGKHGAYDTLPEYAPRCFNLRCWVKANSYAELLEALQGIAQTLDSRSGLKSLLFDKQNDRYWLARYQADMKVSPGAVIAEFELGMICPDPFAYSWVASEDVQDIVSDPQTIMVVVGGDMDASPVIELTAIEDKADAVVSIQNRTFGIESELQWIGGLAEGDILKIDSERMTVYLNDLPSMAGVTASEFPVLKGNAINYLTVSGFPSGTIRSTWSNRWL
ncbi:MAG: phage tail family protein [Dehalococcoidia bacterium]|nr:phage tail family protein [Dehalococcoidia bacterium]